jgi:hypothetical protein
MVNKFNITCVFVFFLFSFFSVLETELGALYLPGKRSSTEPNPQPLTCVFVCMCVREKETETEIGK